MKRTMSFGSVALAAVFGALLAVPVNAQTRAGARCPQSGDTSVVALHRSWILEGWEKRPGDGPFRFREKLGRYYDFSAIDGVFYDDFDPQHRVARSAAAYGSIFEGPFNAMRSARHAVTDGPEVVVGSDTAASTLEFVARLEGGDGTITAIRTRSSVVWRCTAEGWRIVREHNSSRIVPAAEVDAVLARSPRGAGGVDR